MKKMTSKMKKVTYPEYHGTVVPAFKAYRKAMKAELGITTDHYVRIFTEKRTCGARSKYWFARETMPSMVEYVKKNPTFSAGGSTYKVTYEDGLGGYFQSSSRCLFCNKIN